MEDSWSEELSQPQSMKQATHFTIQAIIAFSSSSTTTIVIFNNYTSKFLTAYRLHVEKNMVQCFVVFLSPVHISYCDEDHFV